MQPPARASLLTRLAANTASLNYLAVGRINAWDDGEPFVSSLILSSSNRRKRNRTGYRCRTAASIFAHSSASPKEKVLDVRGDRAWRKPEIVAARVGLRPRLYKSPSHQALQPIPSQIPETIAARYPRRARTSAATALLEQGQGSRKRRSALPKSRCCLLPFSPLQEPEVENSHCDGLA
jgi:hypothetical protein